MDSLIKPAPAVLLAAIVAATLTTAYIHFTLGGLLFLLNAAGYVTLAALVIAPLAFMRRLRPLVLIALAGYTITTIVGWAIMGPYFALAYFTKAVELVLLMLIGLELFRSRGAIIPALRYGRSVAATAIRFALRRPAPTAAESET